MGLWKDVRMIDSADAAGLSAADVTDASVGAVGSGPLPILEYDPDASDVVGDGFRAADAAKGLRIPRRGVVTFLGDVSRGWAREQGWEVAFNVDMVTGDFPIWVGEYDGVEVAFAEAPVGAPAAAIVFDRMIMLGVDTIVAAGSCGSLVPHEVGDFLVPTKALRDEGTSYHYLPASRWVETDTEVRQAIEATITGRGLRYQECPTWTTDAFFRETPGLVASRRDEGCETVEMECAAFAAIAKFRGARFAQILYSADTLAGEHHDVRGWGADARDTALHLALESVTRVAD